MKPFFLSPDLSVTLEDGHLAICGDLTRLNSPGLLQWLEGQEAVAQVNLAEMDIEDGVAATEAVNVVRLMLTRVPVLCIESAPQVLAHNLYRTGLLREGRISLVAMREDEAYG